MLGPERPLGAGGGDWGRPQQISLRPLRRPPRIVPVGVRQVGDSTELRPWWVSGPRMGLASRCVAGLLYSPKVPPRVNLHCRRCHCTRRWAPRYCYRVLWGGETAPAPGSVSPCIPTSARPGLLHPVAGLVLEKVSTRRNARLSPASSGPRGAYRGSGTKLVVTAAVTARPGAREGRAESQTLGRSPSHLSSAATPEPRLLLGESGLVLKGKGTAVRLI